MKPNEIIIHDNFLDKKVFKELQKTLLEENSFPWYLNYNKVTNDNVIQFTHVFYYDFAPNSPYYNNLLPFFSILQPNAIKRVKANLTFKSNKIESYGLLQDFTDELSVYQMKTGIFYLNTTNGPTIFEKTETIKSIENRMIIFPTKMLHAGSTHTDTEVRGVINFNWF